MRRGAAFPFSPRRAYSRPLVARKSDEPIFDTDTGEEGKAVAFWDKERREAIVLFAVQRGKRRVVTTETFTGNNGDGVLAAMAEAGWDAEAPSDD